MEVIKKKKDLGLKKFLKSLDIYGINVSFTINKESTSKTLVGGILTILSFLTFLIYGYFISQNLLYHKNPVIARIGYIGGNYTDIENILSVIPISFKFEGIEIDNLFNYFTVFTYYEVLNVSNNELIIVEEIPFEKCNKNYYPDISENTYYSEISNESLCLNGTNLKNKPKLFLSEGKKGLIFIQLSYCRKEKNPNCESKEKIMDFINGTKNSFSIKLGITGLYPLNYKNPLLHSLETYSIIPTIHYLKNIDISIQEEDLETDDGYFIEKSKKIRTFSSFKAFPFFQKDNNDINLAFFTINPSNRIINNIRTYDRIQDILSDIGGISSIVLTIAGMLNLLIHNFIVILDTEDLALNTEQDNYNSREMSRRPTIFRKANEVMFPPRRPYQPRKQSYGNDPQQQQSSNYQRLMKDGVDIYPNMSSKDEKSEQYKNLYLKRGNILNNNYEGNKDPSYQQNISKGYGGRGQNYNRGMNRQGQYMENKETYSKNLKDETTTEKKEEIENRPLEKQNFNWCKFLGYLICCGRNDKKMSYYEDFRAKLISEENIIQNYLDTYKLLKHCGLKKTVFNDKVE